MVKGIKARQADYIKFLGTAGARFVVIRQLRASGGIWVSYRGTNVLIDPGPGSIVRCAQAQPRVDPACLDGIILTHKHLDHANDINVMIEAMTEGGFKKRGAVFCPGDALEGESVISRHAIGFPRRVEALRAGKEYRVGAFRFTASMRHIHPVETYGIKFSMHDSTVAVLTDTRYFSELTEFYRADILIAGVVFLQPREGIDHLSLPEAETLIKESGARRVILTHFGMTMLKANPALLARKLSKKLGVAVSAAFDGMTVGF